MVRCLKGLSVQKDFSGFSTFCITSTFCLPPSELAAEFISRPQNQEVVEGEKAEFTCSVSKETFEVRWLKDEQELHEGDRYQLVSNGKRRTLIIKNSELKDEGGYVVVIGTTRASADLTVLGKCLPLLIVVNVTSKAPRFTELVKYNY